MTECIYKDFTWVEVACSFCDGEGRDAEGLVCDVCEGDGFYMDACCTEHAEEYELDLYHQSQHMEPDHE